MSPSPGKGLAFDSESGVLSGTYTGTPTVVEYTVTATNKYNSVSFTFVISYLGNSIVAD